MDENSEKNVQEQLFQHIALAQSLASQQTGKIVEIARILMNSLNNNGCIYLCGNGGSAADAQHVAAELVGKYLKIRRALPAVALTTNSSILTAIVNDYDQSVIFSRQVEALVTEKDVVVGISTSGKSSNILKAVQSAQELGAYTIGFCGLPGEPLSSSVDTCFCVPSDSTPRIQEIHILAWHIICDLIEMELCNNSAKRTRIE